MRYAVTLAGLTALAALGFQGGRADEPKREPLVEQVRKAIEEGVRYLKQNQRPGGAWDEGAIAVNHPGGPTCLALLALLNSGVPVTDQHIKDGLTHIRGLERPTTYVRSLQTMVYVEAGLAEDKGRVQANVDHLLKIRLPGHGKPLEGWSYDQAGGNLGGRADNSNTQYALLALYMGRVGGAKIERKVWEEIRDFYIRTQNEDGGWGYTIDNRGPFQKIGSTLTMTTAGLSGLLISGMELNEGREKIRADGTAANCGVYKENEPVKRALSWISSPRIDRLQFDLRDRAFYNIYGIERAGRLSGERFFYSHDWYREGCQYLVKRKRADDKGGCYWREGGAWDSWPNVSTSFALLFLSKGRTPILISKLVHGLPRFPGDGDWNNDRNDCRNLVDFASKAVFEPPLPLAWQTFNILRAVENRAGAALTPDDKLEITSDLLQSPIVYFNGHKSPARRFTGAEKELLKEYVENGGFILAEACCGSKDFDRGFHTLCKDLWGEENPLEYLPAEHPVWTSCFKIPPGTFKLKGIQMGCKTVLIYSPQDLSCQWESNDRDGRARLAFEMGANIIAYATGREPPRPRLTKTEVVNLKEDVRTVPRGFLKVAQLQHDGDWRPAPRAMGHLMGYLRTQADLNVVLNPETVPFHSTALVDFKFVYMHGRKEFRQPGEKELLPLRFNLENGGLLLADACCGSKAFDKAFREFVKRLLPKHKLEPIPATDLLFSKELNKDSLTDHNIRCRRERNKPYINMQPALEGVKVNGRWAVIYSRYDLGCALEGKPSSDCLGYDPDSARLLAGAAVLYLLRP